MNLFHTDSIQQIPARDSHVFAFRITGHVDDDDAEALAKFMNTAFDNARGVNMLLLLDWLEGSDWDRFFKPEVLKSRLRSLTNVRKYAVVGAPKAAARMIEAMDWLVPVDAETFERAEIDRAWAFVDSAPADRAATPV